MSDYYTKVERNPKEVIFQQAMIMFEKHCGMGKDVKYLFTKSLSVQ